MNLGAVRKIEAILAYSGVREAIKVPAAGPCYGKIDGCPHGQFSHNAVSKISDKSFGGKRIRVYKFANLATNSSLRRSGMGVSDHS